MADKGKPSRAKRKSGTRDAEVKPENGTAGEKKAEQVPKAEEKGAQAMPDTTATAEDETKAETLMQDENRPEIQGVSANGSAEGHRKGGAIGLVLGGAVAAGLGYGAAWYGLVGGADDTDVQAALSAQSQQIGKLRSQLDSSRLEAKEGISKAQADYASLNDALSTLREDIARIQSETGNLTEQLKAISARQDEIAARLDGLEKRISEIEKRPISDAKGAVAAAVAAYEQEIADLRARLEAQSKKFEELDREIEKKISEALTQAEKIGERAAKSSALAEAEAALARIRGAIETGGGFGEALETITRTLGISPPPALAEAAKKGVAPLAELQAEFPEMARAALAASLRAAPAQSPVERLGAFLKSQVAPRSLEPREGDDPDAVLSRAEAALKAGDLEKALAILDALPEAGKAAMESWTAKARQRLEVIRALEEVQKAVAAKREGE